MSEGEIWGGERDANLSHVVFECFLNEVVFSDVVPVCICTSATTMGCLSETRHCDS